MDHAQGRSPMTPQALRAFLERLQDCDLAVYADLGARTVLGADAALRVPQEYLDALCDCAAFLFAAAPGDAPVEEILFLGPTGGRGFFRSAAEPGEALCVICAPDADLGRLSAEARAALSGGAGA